MAVEENLAGRCHRLSHVATHVENCSQIKHRVSIQKSTTVLNEGRIGEKAKWQYSAVGFTRKVSLKNRDKYAWDSRNGPLTIRSICALYAGPGATVYLPHNAEHCELHYSGNPAVERKPWFDAVSAEGNWSAGVPLNQTLGRMMFYSPSTRMFTYFLHNVMPEQEYTGCPTKASMGASGNDSFVELEAESPAFPCEPQGTAAFRTRVWFIKMDSHPTDDFVRLLGKGRM
jgi:hypothetical protein